MVVYGPQEDCDKAIFLEELEAIRDACSGPWAITGDFNLILNEADKNNDRIDQANLRRFRRTVDNLGLQDLHLHGRCFTWSNERDSPTLVRLDRLLVSIDWDEKFSNAHLRGLGSDASYHCPLLLQTNMGQMSKARFHFQLFWPKFDDYDEVIAQAWQRPTMFSDPMARLE
jgi:exonuclease III